VEVDDRVALEVGADLVLDLVDHRAGEPVDVELLVVGVVALDALGDVHLVFGTCTS
jgi:hypothetical protein